MSDHVDTLARLRSASSRPDCRPHGVIVLVALCVFSCIAKCTDYTRSFRPSWLITDLSTLCPQ